MPLLIRRWRRDRTRWSNGAISVRQAFEDELAGCPPTGMHPHRETDGLWFHRCWEVTVAQRR